MGRTDGDIEVTVNSSKFGIGNTSDMSGWSEEDVK